MASLKARNSDKQRKSSSTRSKSNEVVLIPSSTEPRASGNDSDHDPALDFDFNFDFDFENDFAELEAALQQKAGDVNSAETAEIVIPSRSASPPSWSGSQEKPSAPSTEVRRRRAISDRPKFRLARSSQTSDKGKTPTADSGISGTEQQQEKPESRDEYDMWWQKYEPQNTADLAVHSGKIAQVRGWLGSAIAASNGNDNGPSSYFRILVLEGPAGAGKSTCIRTLAKELGLDVVEWLNTQSSKHSVASTLEYDDSSVGVVKQFEDFLLRAERYSSLALSSTGSSRTTNVIQSASRRSSGQIILVDDLPNISHKDTRDSFRSALLKFISIPARRSFPMVIVVTEAFAAHNVLEDSGEFGAVGGRLRENDKSSHSEIGIWCASDILPSAVFNSPYCQSIKFNPVAPTIIAKGLKRILQIQQGPGTKSAPKFSSTCTAAIKEISNGCNGDLRSAITMLQLSQAAHANQTPRPEVGSKRRRGAGKMVDILDSSRIAESRYASLDVFHALGKVLYAKRERPGAQNDNSGESRGRLESNPDEVLDRLPMDMSTFGLYIHEGYTDFCTSIDEAAQISSHLSDADTVSGSKGARRAGNAFATTAEVYSAMLTARGFMHAKGHPLLAGEDDQSSSNSTQDRYRRHMNPFRKPQFFDSYKQRVLNSKLSDDPVAAEILTAGGLTAAGLLATRQGFTQHILPYWADISAHGQSGMHFQQRYPAMYRQLMYLAMVSSDAVASQQLQTLAISQNSGQVAAENAATEQGGLVLSDDDIDDFSD